MPRQPNILFIFTDQQTRDAMGAYGNPHVRTPHMDSLAAGGVAFWNSYCTSPVCTPSRASMITGRMPHELGVEINDLPLPVGVPTLGELFQRAGYATAWAGKWHLPESYPTGEDGIRGFTNLVLPRTTNMRLGTLADDAVAKRAVKFLREKRSQPFLLCVSIENPHDICHWIMGRDKETLDQFLPTGELPPLPDNFEVDSNEPEFIQICRERPYYGYQSQWANQWDESGWRRYLHVYNRMVEHADVRVGRILDALRQSNLEEDTLVIFTSDHGEGVAAHRWVVKLMLYEEPVTVPLVLRWKNRIPEGRMDRVHLASGLDIVLTLCDYAGIEPPPGLHGRSLRSAIKSPSQDETGFVVAELQPDPKRMELKGRMLRTARFKYIAFSHGRSSELLFDLTNDPGETRNLADKAGFRSELEQHRLLLAGWMGQTHDEFRRHAEAE